MERHGLLQPVTTKEHMSGPQDHTSDDIELLPADAVTADGNEVGGVRGSSGEAMCETMGPQ